MNIKNIHWSKPISRQWPLMLAYIIMIGWISVTKNPIPRWMLIFLHAYIIASLVTLSKSKVVKWLAYFIIYVLFIFELILEQLFGMNISPEVIVLLVETNIRESMEFMESMKGKSQWIGIPIYLLCIIVLNLFAERYHEKINNKLKDTLTAKGLKVVAAILLIGGVVFSYHYIALFRCQEMNEVDEWRSHMRHPDDLVTKLVVSFYDISLSEKEMTNVILLSEQKESLKITSDSDSLNIIVIIGESYIREHSPLYGYPLQTTPFLSQEKENGRLFVFTDVVSPYNQTTRVIRNMLSCNSLGDGESWASAPPFTALYKKGGYHVVLYDNQKTIDFGQVFTFSLNTYLYHPRIVNACYNETNDNTFEYDGELVEYYRQKRSVHPAPHQLLLFHLMGQHISFNKRYPPGFNHFNADSTIFRQEEWLTEGMRKDIAHYDNATRYNDYVIQQIIDLYAQQNTVVILMADHGEEVYDYRDNMGRDDWDMGSNPEQVLRFQYMIPFVVWCSDKYMERHPNTITQLQEATGRPMMLDNMCQLLFHLSGLHSRYYHAERDILSPSYHCPPRIINDKQDCTI